MGEIVEQMRQKHAAEIAHAEAGGTFEWSEGRPLTADEIARMRLLHAAELDHAMKLPPRVGEG